MIELVFMSLTVIVMLLAGFPIALVLGLTGVVWTWAYSAAYLPGVAHTVMNTLSSETLIAIPLFILMGQIVQMARIAERFYEALAGLLVRLPGGLLHANILACGLFSAVSGSSIATASTIATAAVPSQRRFKYDLRLTTGSLAAGGTLGILIPPSIPLIVYCSLIEESVGLMFIAALVPALLLLVLFHAYVLVRALANPDCAPAPAATEGGLTGAGFVRDVLPLTVIVSTVIVTIYTGLMTASEAAAGGVAISILVALLGRTLSLRTLGQAIVASARLSAMILFIVVGAQIFSYGVFTWGFNAIIGDQVAALPWPPIAVLGVLILIYLVLGMFVDAISLLLMTVPVVHPVVTMLGYDPIWFGVLLVLLLEIGLITPPVGMNLFTIKAVANEVSLKDITVGALPFVGILLASVGLLIAFPALALWLPFH